MAESVKKAKAPAKPKTTTKKAAAKPTPISNHHAPSHEEIAELAQKYWAERGYADGQHEEDWFRAEQELRAKAS
jgi:hypothetical protein